MPTFQPDDVRPDVVHGVLRGVAVPEQQVVLAEHSPGHPPQYCAHLGTRGRPSDRAEEAWKACAVLSSTREHRTQQPPKRRDVGVDPFLPRGNLRPRAGPASERRPVDSSTSASAWAVTSPKSITSERSVAQSTRVSRRRATRPATRSATSHATGSLGGVISAWWGGPAASSETVSAPHRRRLRQQLASACARYRSQQQCGP